MHSRVTRSAAKHKLDPTYVRGLEFILAAARQSAPQLRLPRRDANGLYVFKQWWWNEDQGLMRYESDDGFLYRFGVAADPRAQIAIIRRTFGVHMKELLEFLKRAVEHSVSAKYKNENTGEWETFCVRYKEDLARTCDFVLKMSRATRK